MAFPVDFTPQHPDDGEFLAGVRATLIPTYIERLTTLKGLDLGISKKHAVKSGTTAVVPVPGIITFSLTALPAQADPSPLTVDDSTVTVPTAEHGDFLPVMEQLILQKDINGVVEIGLQLLDAYDSKFEDLKAAVMFAGSNVMRPNNRASAGELLPGDVITPRDFSKINAILGDRKIVPFGGRGGNYRGFLSPLTIDDLFGDNTHLGLASTMAPTTAAPFMTGQIARLFGIDVFKVQHGTNVSLAAGNDEENEFDANLIRSLFVGQDFCHMGEQLGFQMWFDSIGKDHMRRIKEWAWKHYAGWKRVREEAAIRFESRSPISANP